MKSKKIDINNWSYKSLFIILFFLLISIVVLWKFVLPNHKVEASWWNDGWNYRKAISINNSGTAQTNTQIKILDNYDLSALVTAGKLQADLDDLRFTDINGNLLKYWIEDSTNNSVDVWGIIPSLPVSGTTTYMYYGNSSATSVSSTLNMTIGGTMTSINGYRIHTFLGNGTLTNANNITAEVLVVAGGGGGGSSTGAGGGGAAGGGAGGLTYNASYTLTKGQIINVTVGIGGTNGATSLNQVGTDGGTSIFGTITVNGGGGGANTGANGRPGGSGGGGGYNYYSTVKYGGAGVVGIGNSGGATTDLTSAAGAGGGGAGGAGGNNKPSHIGGDGGLGILYSITGIGVTYASGGRGGGGAAPVVKAVNTGNGGDGAYSTGTPTSGASGIVVVRFLSGTASAPSTEEAGGGPIAYWKFDEGTGTTAYDSSSNSHTGTLQNGTSWASENQCVSGKCLKFDGVDDYVSAGTGTNYLPLDNFSMCAWVKSPGLASGMTVNGIMSFTYGLSMSLDSSGQFRSLIDNGSNLITVTVSGNLYDNKFHYLCTTFDGTNRYMYVDGKLKNSTATTWNNRYTSNTVNIGHENNNPPVYKFNGFIDEPKIYRYARTADQIKKDYNSRGGSSQGTSANLGSAGNDNNLSDGLVGYWKMDENVGTSIADSSGLGYTGIFGTGDSAPSWSTGKFGVGTSFDGTNDYINFGNPGLSSLTNATISFWRKASNSNAWLLFQGQTTSHYLMATHGTDAFYHANIGSITKIYVDGNIATTPLTDTNWHHYVITGVNLSTWTNLRLSNYPNFQYNGLIDEIRIYNRSLSPSEVSQLYEFAPGPITYYDFNEASGTITYDKSGNNKNGTLQNSPSWIQGKYGRALDFNASGQRVLIGTTTPISGQATATLWYKTTNFASTTWRTILADTTANIHQLSIHNTSRNLGLWDGGWKDFNYKPLDDNQFHFYAIVYDIGSSATLYVDGVYKSKIYTTLNLTTNPIGSIGNWNGGGYWSGSIDDVKIYNYARTPKQIIEDMNANHPAVSANSAIAYYKFDEGNGTTIYDSSPSKINATMLGTTLPTWQSSDCIKGKCLAFPGGAYMSGYVVSNSSVPVSDVFTISHWIKTNSGGYSISNSGDGNGYRLGTYGGHVQFLIGNSSGLTETSCGTKIVNDNKWHQVTGIYDNPNHKFTCYVDGKYEATVTVVDFTGFSTSAPMIGGYNYNGLIDEVKFYNYALTADEVKQDYNAGSALQMGQTSQTIGGTTTSLEYCIPGDTSYCASPVAEWKMDEGSGTSAKDTSGNNNTGNLGTGNSAPSWTQGKTGSALSFNGSSNYIGIPYSSSLTPASSITFEAWAYKPSWTDAESSRILSKTENGGYTLLYSSGSIYSYIYRNGAYSTPSASTSGLSPGWHYFTGSYDGRYNKIYIDGVLKNTDDAGANYPITYSYSNSLIIGAEAGSGTSPAGTHFTGKIDQVKIYNYARTPAQIAYDYNKGGPVGWWKFDECQGNIAYDWSGIGNTGTIIIGASGTQNSLGTCSIGTSAAWTNGSTGKLNSSLNFDGTDDYITIPNLLTDYPVSVSMWIKPNTITDADIAFYLYLASGKYITGGFYTSYGFITNASNVHADASLFPIGQWKHVVVTMTSSTTGKIYVDGIDRTTSSAQRYVESGTISNIAARNNSNLFQGQIDDVKVYNYALTDTQVKTLYNNGAVSFN